MYCTGSSVELLSTFAMELVPTWFIVILIPSFSAGLAPTVELVHNPELYEAMKIENVEKVFGPNVFENAPVYDEDKGEMLPAGAVAISPSTVQFYLYSSLNPALEWKIDFSEESRSMFDRNFNESAPTKIICHGFMSNYKQGPGSLLLSAYFKAYKHLNVILVDWSYLAGVYRAPPKMVNRYSIWSNLFYFPPARNTQIVGKTTADLINFLVNDKGASPSNIHLIGHSLGAHAMGDAGLAVQLDLNEKVGRITALDPAGPCFEKMSLVCFLQTYRPIMNTDAQFVDAIHTHSKVFGMEGAVGHVDFYPNGGADQEGCSTLSFGICSHHRAIEQMADSILFGRIQPGKNYLEAKQCSDWKTYNNGLCTSTATSELGEFCSFGSNGKYYLKMKPLNTLQRGILLGTAGMSLFMLAKRRAEMSKVHFPHLHVPSTCVYFGQQSSKYICHSKSIK